MPIFKGDRARGFPNFGNIETELEIGSWLIF